MLNAWIIAGIVLILLELVVPGLVLVFLGAAALLVAAGIGLGFIEGWIVALTAWFVISLILVLGLRGLLERLQPKGYAEVNVGSTDEDADAFGKIVDVVETIPEGGRGRVAFAESSWPATCPDATVPAGRKVKLVSRENLVWVVTPAGYDLADGDKAPG